MDVAAEFLALVLSSPGELKRKWLRIHEDNDFHDAKFPPFKQTKVFPKQAKPIPDLEKAVHTLSCTKEAYNLRANYAFKVLNESQATTSKEHWVGDLCIVYLPYISRKRGTQRMCATYRIYYLIYLHILSTSCPKCAYFTVRASIPEYPVQGSCFQLWPFATHRVPPSYVSKHVHCHEQEIQPCSRMTHGSDRRLNDR